MAKSKWFILLLTELFSALSLICLIVAFSTDHWVASEIKFVASGGESSPIGNSNMFYGLFDGKLNRNTAAGPRLFDLTITCRFDENKCFYSCQQTSERRDDEFSRILSGSGQDLEPCPLSKSRMQLRVSEQVAMKINYAEGDDDDDAPFLSAGLWVTTAVFLGLSSGLALVCAFFSMINIACNPVRMLSSTFGLFVWNGCAAALCVITMIVWASCFALFISKNVAITDTLRRTGEYSSAGLAHFGYSFWLLLAPIFCHLINIGLLHYRNYLLQREPPPPVHIDIHKNDSTILVY